MSTMISTSSGKGRLLRRTLKIRRATSAAQLRKISRLKAAEKYKIHGYLTHANGLQILSDQDINRAVRTVRIRNVGDRWLVKKVADPKVWSFQHSDTALAKAVNLAKPEAWSVVMHGKSGRITQVIAPSQFDNLTINVKPARSKAGPTRRRQNQQQHVATPQPA